MPDPKISMRLPASHIPAPAATTAAPPRRARRESGGAVTNCSALEAILLHSLGMSNALKRLADGALNRLAGTNLGSFRPADPNPRIVRGPGAPTVFEQNSGFMRMGSGINGASLARRDRRLHGEDCAPRTGALRGHQLTLPTVQRSRV